MLKGKDKKLANRIVQLTLDAGDNAVAEVIPALERALAGRGMTQRRHFIRYFLQMLRRELRKETLRVEYAGSITEELIETLKARFGKEAVRPLRVEQVENPGLLGGLRIQLGDNVYDASIQGRLTKLQHSVR